MDSKVKSEQIIKVVSYNTHSFWTDFALKFFSHKKCSKFAELFLIFFEYFQLISQGILINSGLYNEFNGEDKAIFKWVIYAAKLLNPAYLLSFQGDDNLTKVVLCIITFSAFLKYILACYAFIITLLGLKGFQGINNIWSVILIIQGRILYFFFTSFWANAIFSAYQNEFDFFDMNRSLFVAICFFLILLEGILTLSTQTLTWYTLPQKGMLSKKDNYNEIITFLQKATIQILQIILPFNTLQRDWILIGICFLFNITRAFHFLTILPFYNIRTLFIHDSLGALIFSLTIANLFSKIIQSIDGKISDEGFRITSWIIIGALSIKLRHNFLSKRILNLSTTAQNADPKLLVHKVFLIKQLRKLRIFPCEFHEAYKWSYLVNSMISAKLETIFMTSNKKLKLDLFSKEASNLIFLTYLENLLARFPRSTFVNLHCANFYAKKMKLYGKALKIVSELQKQGGFRTNLNTSLLLIEMQKNIQEDYEKETHSIDLSTYIKNQVASSNLKEKILNQADLQIKLCQENIADIPDLRKILNYAISISNCRKTITKEIKELLKISPDYNVTPLLLFANYHLVLNYSFIEYTNYMKSFTKKNQNCLKHFQNYNLTQKNLYQAKNAFILISGQKADAGKIVYCSQQAANLLGGEVNAFLGTNISSIFLPKAEGFNDKFFKTTIETGNANTFSINHLSKGFIYNQDGYMIKVDYYINIYPILTHGFYLSVIIRPELSTTDYLLIHQNGDIEGATEKIGRKLGIRSSYSSSLKRVFNVELLSNELARANIAFNIAEKHCSDNLELNYKNEPIIQNQNEKTVCGETHDFLKGYVSKQIKGMTNLNQSKMDIDKAFELYDCYRNEGKELNLFATSLKGRGSIESIMKFHPISHQLYHCKIDLVPFESLTMKLITLNEVKNSHNQEEFEATNETPDKIDTTLHNFESGFVKRSDIQEFEEGFSEYFKSEDEKQEGWIDIKAFQSTSIGRNTLLSGRDSFHKGRHNNYLLTIEGPLLSPQNHRQPQIYPTVSMKTTALFDSQQFNSKIKKSIDSVAKFSNSPKSPEGHGFLRKEGDRSVATSKLSKISNQIRLSKAFEIALNSKYCSRFVSGCNIFFYVLILCLFAAQIYLKETMNSTEKMVNIKVDILMNAQLRTYHLANLQTMFRQINDLGTGRITQQDIGLIAKPISEYIYNSTNYLQTLIEANRQILVNAHLLEEDIRNVIFSRNVRIYDPRSSSAESNLTYMTSFQGTQSIIESALELQDIISADPSQGELEFEYILRNSLNDLYIENDNISDIFLRSVKDQINYVKSIVVVYLATASTLLFLNTFIICLIVWKSYSITKKIIEAFVKLNKAKVENVLYDLNNFNHALKVEADLNKCIKWEKTDYSKSQNHSIPQRVKREKFTLPNSKGIKKSHILHIVKWGILVLGIVGFLIGRVVLALVSMNYCHTKVLELDFTYRMTTQINIAVIVIMELLIPNGSKIVEDTPIDVAIVNTINNIVSLRTQVNKVLVNEDLLKDEIIHNNLFYDGCSVLDSGFLIYCTTLEKEGINTSFIQLLSTLEDLIRGKYQRYVQSDKSVASLKIIEVDRYDTLISIKRVLLGSSNKISTAIDNIYSHYMANIRKTRSVIFNISTVYFVLASVLTWILILSKVKNTYNQLKKVLRTLPPELILSSFILKKFLMKTSQGALDYVRNNI